MCDTSSRYLPCCLIARFPSDLDSRSPSCGHRIAVIVVIRCALVEHVHSVHYVKMDNPDHVAAYEVSGERLVRDERRGGTGDDDGW